MVLRSLQIIHDAPRTTRLQSITSNASLVATQRLWVKRWHGTCEQEARSRQDGDGWGV